MGYRGPTVFGENASPGLGKDPFGLMLDLHLVTMQKKLGKEVEKLGFALSDKGKTGLRNMDATFNPATGLFDGGPRSRTIANRMKLK